MMDEPDLAQIQAQLARQVILPPEGEGYQPQAGDLLFSLDIQYEGEIAYAAADILAWPDRPLGLYVARAAATVPYIPQFFCFREGPPLLTLLQQVGLEPALLLVDGHGLAHPRRLGLASWLGVLADLPAIGCAKETLLPYNKEEIELRRGNYGLIKNQGDPVGVALVTQDKTRPVFVSPGHRVSLATSLETVLHLATRYRLPEPLRRADGVARAYARNRLPPTVTILS